MTSVNEAYTEAQTYHYVTLNNLLIPPSTKETRSFSVTLTEAVTNLAIETLSTGITMKPLAGALAGASVQPSSPYINQKGVTYKFRFTLEDPILISRGTPTIKVTFPD
jgi:hypothetical protein